jgi:hypothetical protein
MDMDSPQADHKKAERRNVFPIVLISAGGVALCMYLYDQVRTREAVRGEIAGNGVLTEARIVKKTQDRETVRTGAEITVYHHYMVEYEFQADGKPVRGQGRVGKSLWDQMREGGTAAVYYLPGNTSAHVLRPADEPGKLRKAKIVLWLCGSLVAIFVLGGLSYLNRIRRGWVR